MTSIEQYPEFVNSHLYKDGTTWEERMTLAALGLCGEAGEFADSLKKYLFQHGDYNEKHVVEELGDILWYLQLACNLLRVSLDDVAEINMAKLKERYPIVMALGEKK